MPDEKDFTVKIKALFAMESTVVRSNMYSALMSEMPDGPQRRAVKQAYLAKLYGGKGIMAKFFEAAGVDSVEKILKTNLLFTPEEIAENEARKLAYDMTFALRYGMGTKKIQDSKAIGDIVDYAKFQYEIPWSFDVVKPFKSANDDIQPYQSKYAAMKMPTIKMPTMQKFKWSTADYTDAEIKVLKDAPLPNYVYEAQYPYGMDAPKYEYQMIKPKGIPCSPDCPICAQFFASDMVANATVVDNLAPGLKGAKEFVAKMLDEANSKFPKPGHFIAKANATIDAQEIKFTVVKDKTEDHPPEPYCYNCHKPASELFAAEATAQGMTPAEYAREDGTYNPANNRFACDDCYIAAGMPSGPRGWMAP